MSYLILFTFLLAPTYVFRFNFFGLPANLLMLWVFCVWLIFFIYLLKQKQNLNFYASLKKNKSKHLPAGYLTPQESYKSHSSSQQVARYSGKVLDKIENIFIGLFILSGIVSLFISGLNQKALGEFLVLFVQPISIYYIGRFLFSSGSESSPLQDPEESLSPQATGKERFPNTKYYLLYTIYFLLAAAGLYAIIQYFTGFNLPLLFQGNDFEPRRAISFFDHANFYALWCAPLLAFLIPDVASRIRNFRVKIKFSALFIALWILGAFGLLLSLSRAGWIGLVSAIIIYIIFAGDKKIRTVFIAGLIVVAGIIYYNPLLKARVISPFSKTGEKSAQSRVALWQSGIKAIKQSPVFGMGLLGYSKEYRNLIADQTLPDHNFPHNIFLDLWVETGIMGLVGLMGLVGFLTYQGLTNRANLFKLSIALFLIALLAQGQFDNPYFKNDLAMVFWIILSLI